MTKKDTPTSALEGLIQQMRKAYWNFLETCENLSPEQAQKGKVCGVWTAKQVVDHLTGWQTESLTILSKLLESPSSDFNYHIDAFNRTAVKEREDLNWEESLFAFKDSFRTFDEALKNLISRNQGTRQAISDWIKAMLHEYEFHRQHVNKARGC